MFSVKCNPMNRIKLIICILSISFSGSLLLNTASFCSNKGQVTAEKEDEEKPRTQKSKVRIKIKEVDFAKILTDHKKWVDTDKKEGQMADMSGANLSKANLCKVDLSGADLAWADMSGANMSEANLSGANLYKANMTEADLAWAELPRTHLSGANLSGANLSGANLSGANLSKANLSGANLFKANLSRANLSKANLSKAKLRETDLEDANITYANFKNSIFEPIIMEDKLSFLGANGFLSISFDKAQAVVKLREMAKKAGFRYQERQLTAIIRKNRFRDTSFSERIFENIFLDYPTDFGANPWKCLLILSGFFFVFTYPYVLVLEMNREDGIWKVWPKERLKQKSGSDTPLLLKGLRGLPVLGYAFYFSLLTTFHIGWRDLNIGSWIVRMQPNEYILKSTGWIRFVSGLHSLISIYLLALWALSYFARPFE